MSLRNSWKIENKKHLHLYDSYTKSTLFLLPILGYSYKDFIIDQKAYLHNCYIYDIKKPKLVCVFDNSEDNDDLTIKQNKLITNYSFVSKTYDNDGLELVLTFNLGYEFEKDYYKFLSGEYSKFSEDLKDMLMFTYGKYTDSTSFRPTIYETIYPTEQKRNLIAKMLDVDISDVVEVFDKPELKIEYYRTYDELIKDYED